MDANETVRKMSVTYSYTLIKIEHFKSLIDDDEDA